MAFTTGHDAVGATGGAGGGGGAGGDGGGFGDGGDGGDGGGHVPKPTILPVLVFVSNVTDMLVGPNCRVYTPSAESTASACGAPSGFSKVGSQ